MNRAGTGRDRNEGWTDAFKHTPSDCTLLQRGKHVVTVALLYISKQIGWSDLSRGIATLTRKTEQPINCSWTLCPFKRCGTTRRQPTWSRSNWKYLVTAFAAAAASKSVCPRSSLKARIKLFNLDSVRVTRMKNLIENENRRRGAGCTERRVSVC